MKRLGLQTQNQRNKRKDGEADRWPDASFFPLNRAGKTRFASPYISLALYQTGREKLVEKKGPQRNALRANFL